MLDSVLSSIQREILSLPEGDVLDSVLSSISTRGTCVRLGFIFYPLPEGHVLDSVLCSILYQRGMC